MLGIIFSFVSALIISVIAIPSIIRVSYLKHLYDVPDERKSHTRVIPTLGGLAIFAGFSIATFLFIPNSADFNVIKYLFAGVLIIFFVGIKDDILITAPLKKLIGQLFAAGIIVLMGKVRITSMYGFLGVEEITEGYQLILTTFTLLVIMNGFNLIDGINWLAGGVSLVVSVSFGFYFFLNGYVDYAVISAALAGAILGFLWFNKSPAKIFMGDTGSLIIGLVSGLLCVQFIELNASAKVFQFTSVPIVAFGILIVPLFDTLRVFIWRILKGNSPLHPDQNHIHHRLLELGWSHMKSSIVIITFNGLLVAGLYLFHEYFKSAYLLVVTLLISSIFSFLPSYILRKRNKKNTDYSSSTLKVVQTSEKKDLSEAS